MTYQLTTLPNGLRVASEADSGSLTAAFAIAVDVGARHEREEESGLSHLLEHMAFKGTPRLNARAIAEHFDRMGGNVNAYTSHEHTVYYAKVLHEYADEALALLCEIVAQSHFDETELERERGVVLQEIAMHTDSPDDLVFDLFQQAAYGSQPLGRSILGAPERVAALTREDMLRYTALHYRPDRMSLAAAGAVDHAQLVQTATRYFAARPQGPVSPPVPARYLGGEVLLEKELEQLQLVLGYPCVSTTHADYYAAQVLATILGGGMSSRLFQEVREKRGLAYAVSAFVASYQDNGVLGMSAGCAPEQLTPLLAALREVLAGLADGVDAEELLRAKNQLKAGVVMTRESTGSIAEWIARHLLVYGRYRPAEELLQTIDAVTTEDMIRLAAKFLNGTPSIAVLGPPGGLQGVRLREQLAA